MSDIIETLFGITTPNKDQIGNYRTKDAVDFGTLWGQATQNFEASPDVRNSYIQQQGAIAGLANKGARAIGGVFGIEDPMLQRANTLESILQQTQQELGADAQDPVKMYGTLYNKLSQGGFTKEAMQVQQLAQKAQQEQALQNATIAEKNAQAQKASRDVSEKRFIPVGKNIFDTQTQTWMELPKGAATEEELVSSDKQRAHLNSVYHNDTLPIEVRNKAAKEYNTLVASMVNSGVPVPQLTMLSGGQPDSTSPDGNPNTGLEYSELPGSKAAQLTTENRQKALRTYESVLSSMPDTLNLVANTKQLVSPDTAGVNAWGKHIPGSPAKKLDNQIQTLKSKAVMDMILELKSQSKTGATGFGALSEKELTVLETAITNLDQSTDPQTLKDNLDTIAKYFDKLQKGSDRSLEELTGQKWIKPENRFSFSFSKGTQPNKAQMQQLNKALLSVNKGLVPREQAIQWLKESPILKGLNVEFPIEGYK